MTRLLRRWGVIVPATMLMLVVPGSTASAQPTPCKRVAVTITGGEVVDVLPPPPTINFVEQGAATFTITGLVATGQGTAALKGFETDDPDRIVMLEPLLATDPGIPGFFGAVTGTAESPLFGSGFFELVYQNTNNRNGSCLGQAGELAVEFA